MNCNIETGGSVSKAAGLVEVAVNCSPFINTPRQRGDMGARASELF